MTALVSEKRGRPWARLIGVTCWMYLALTLAAAVLVHWAGDSCWPMTLLTFGPRWVLVCPLVPLTAAALALCRRALVPLLLSAGCAMGPVMGFCVPWSSIAGTEPEHRLLLRAVTLNIDGGTDISALVKFLNEVEPDVVAFQEGPFTTPLLAELKRKFFIAGKSDTIVASRYRIVAGTASPRSKGRRESPAIRCDIATPEGIVHVHCVHLCSLRDGFEHIMKEWWLGAPALDRATANRNEDSQISAEFAKASDGPTVILGDFNMPSDSAVFHRDWRTWQDAFSMRGFGLGYTFTTRRIGLRIDHVLADKNHWYVRSCHAGPDLHGQHRPVVAELLLIENASPVRE